MIDVAALFFAAAICSAIARWLSLPAIPLLLIGGWALALAGHALSDDTLSKALELGLVFLVFASGSELDPRRLMVRAGATLRSALIQMLATALPVYFLAHWLGYGSQISLYLAVAFSASSTLVATRQLRRLIRTQEPFARFSTGLLLAQDFIIVVLIAALAALPSGLGSVLANLAKFPLLLAPALALQRWGLPWLMARRRFAEETLLLFLLAALFLFLGAAFVLDLPLIVGAFFAGITFSRFPASGVVRGQISSMTDFFTALFFTALAQLATRPDPALLLTAAGFAALVLVVRPILAAAMARRSGLDTRASIETGLLVAQVGEYALILALAGFQSGVFGSEHLALVALVTAFTMTVTPFVANDNTAARILHLLNFQRRRRQATATNIWKNHALLVGYGSGGKWVMKPLVDAGLEVLVIDDDPAVAAHLRNQGIQCLLGDGADPGVLTAAGASRARVILASPRRVQDALKVLRYVQRVPVIVRVFEDFEAEQVRQLGGIPVLNSIAGANAFMEWFHRTPIGDPKTRRR